MIFATRTRLVATTALFTCAGAPALAQDSTEGYFLRLQGGASFLSDSNLSGAAFGSVGFDTGFLAGFAVGYDYPDSPFRSELEYNYRTGDADGTLGITGDFASTTLALNGYYDFGPMAGGRVSPYVGAGLAYVTEIDFDVTSGPVGEYSKTGLFGYQLMAGAEIPLTERWSLNGELRYFDAGSQTLTSPTGAILNADYDTLDLLFGATVRF